MQRSLLNFADQPDWEFTMNIAITTIPVLWRKRHMIPIAFELQISKSVA